MRVERDRRLAGADVPLQQAVHRHRPLHIGGDFGNDALLRARQFVAEFYSKLFQNAARIERKAVLTRTFRLLLFNSDKIQQRVFKVQAFSRQFQCFPAERKMRVPQRQRERRKPVLLDNLLRQRFVDSIPNSFQRGHLAVPPGTLVQPFYRGVHGQNAG